MMHCRTAACICAYSAPRICRPLRAVLESGASCVFISPSHPQASLKLPSSPFASTHPYAPTSGVQDYYLTAIWKFMAMSHCILCERERERKAPLIHLVCGGAEIVKFHQVLCLALLLGGALPLAYPFLFLFLSSSTAFFLIACVQQQCPPRACRPPR